MQVNLHMPQNCTLEVSPGRHGITLIKRSELGAAVSMMVLVPSEALALAQMLEEAARSPINPTLPSLQAPPYQFVPSTWEVPPKMTLAEARAMAGRNEPLPEDFYIDRAGEVQVKPDRHVRSE